MRNSVNPLSAVKYSLIAALVLSSIIYCLSGIKPGFGSSLPSGLLILLLELCMVGLVVTAIYITRLCAIYIGEKVKYAYQNRSYAEIDNMNRVLRTQRHDFVNHMQILSVMLKMSKIDRAMEYLDNMLGEINDVNAPISTGIIELNALFLAKWNSASRNGITMNFDIRANLSDVSIPPLELTRIIGNLLENALYASGKSSASKLVQVSICENIANYVISITNTGPEIPPSMHDKIFLPGYSTKEKEGHGLGLYIVKTLLEKYNSCIFMRSSKEEGTNFTIIIPKEL